MCCAAFPLCLKQRVNFPIEEWSMRPIGGLHYGSQVEACCTGSITIYFALNGNFEMRMEKRG